MKILVILTGSSVKKMTTPTFSISKTSILVSRSPPFFICCLDEIEPLTKKIVGQDGHKIGYNHTTRVHSPVYIKDKLGFVLFVYLLG